jgi:hypothetical protein
MVVRQSYFLVNFRALEIKKFWAKNIDIQYTNKVKTKQLGVLLVAIALLCIKISFFLKSEKNG